MEDSDDYEAQNKWGAQGTREITKSKNEC